MFGITKNVETPKGWDEKELKMDFSICQRLLNMGGTYTGYNVIFSTFLSMKFLLKKNTKTRFLKLQDI